MAVQKEGPAGLRTYEPHSSPELRMLGEALIGRTEDVVERMSWLTRTAGPMLDPVLEGDLAHVGRVSTIAVARWMAGEGLEVARQTGRESWLIMGQLAGQRAAPLNEVTKRCMRWFDAADEVTGEIAAEMGIAPEIRAEAQAMLRRSLNVTLIRMCEAFEAERHHLDDEVARAERMFKQLLEFAPDAIVGIRADGNVVLTNHQAELLFGYSRDELIGLPVERLMPERYRESHPLQRADYFGDPMTRPMGAGVELVGVRKDGTEFPAEVSLSSIETDEGVVATAAVRDISERAESERERALAEELNQTRRLESVGQLAGGIAHDFNNLLGVIINYAKFVSDALPEEGQAHEDIEEIRRAAERAANLTRQLLIFSRREVVKSEVLDLNDVVAGLENLLHRALGERIAIETRFATDVWPIEADPGQIEQVLVNLAVNARDAMPSGGRLIIETANTTIDESFADTHIDLEPGRYVRLTVSDSGVGMSPDVRQRAFEPFFTTKSKAEGTGLGLATVYGIVTQGGGRIDLYSEPGMGTTIKVHLPASSFELPEHAASEIVPAPLGHGETILVVEDQPEVRHVTERILTQAGYVVVGASGGVEGLELAATSSVDLLLTDLIMPGMLGTELVERMRAAHPELRVVFMSGYSHAMLAHGRIPESPRTEFIEKPFTADALQRTVRDLLDAEES